MLAAESFYNALVSRIPLGCMAEPEDVMRVVLKFPTPLSNRDYVAKFTKVTDGDAVCYRWESVTDAKAPTHEPAAANAT